MYDSFPICRSIFVHWIYANPEYLKIWITMLGRARYLKEPKKGMYQKVNYELQYGQFIFGRIKWSMDLEIGEQKIRTCIKKLIDDNMIILTRHTMNFTIYEVVNYEKFNQQADIELKGIPDIDNQRITNGQPTDNQRITTNKESKERKEGIKKEYIPLTFIDDDVDKVKITQDQYDKLIAKFSIDTVKRNILALDSYIVNNPKGGKYTDHNKVLNNWCNGKENKSSEKKDWRNF